MDLYIHSPVYLFSPSPTISSTCRFECRRVSDVSDAFITLSWQQLWLSQSLKPILSQGRHHAAYHYIISRYAVRHNNLKTCGLPHLVDKATRCSNFRTAGGSNCALRTSQLLELADIYTSHLVSLVAKIRAINKYSLFIKYRAQILQYWSFLE